MEPTVWINKKSITATFLEGIRIKVPGLVAKAVIVDLNFLE
jgi:hypothetical protein